MRKLLFSFVLLSAVSLTGEQQDQLKKNPEAGKPASIAKGSQRFREGCANCHGAHAEGGRGPRLVDNAALQGLSDEQLFHTIRNGIRGTDMPASPMSDTLTWQVAAFVRNLSSPAFLAPLLGNVEAGRAAYAKAGCADCHMIRGEGGYLGPDLTDIGATRTLNEISTSILDPDKRRVPGFVGVTAASKDGQTILGIAKNESNYTIQILDRAGQLHLLNRSGLSAVRFAPHSLMPGNYAELLSKDEIENVVAFLSRQAVRPDAEMRGRQEDGPGHLP